MARHEAERAAERAVSERREAKRQAVAQAEVDMAAAEREEEMRGAAARVVADEAWVAHERAAGRVWPAAHAPTLADAPAHAQSMAPAPALAPRRPPPPLPPPTTARRGGGNAEAAVATERRQRAHFLAAHLVYVALTPRPSRLAPRHHHLPLAPYPLPLAPHAHPRLWSISCAWATIRYMLSASPHSSLPPQYRRRRRRRRDRPRGPRLRASLASPSTTPRGGASGQSRRPSPTGRHLLARSTSLGPRPTARRSLS